MSLSSRIDALATRVGQEFKTLRATLATQTVPTGAVMPFASVTAPTGWLYCDGRAVSRTTYAALFAVTSTSFGAGDGSTTFNLPNYTNKVMRGSATPGSSAGGADSVTLTTAMTPVHNHTASSASDNHGHTGSTQTDGAHTHTSDSSAASGGSTLAFLRSANTNVLTGGGMVQSGNSNHWHSLTTSLESHSHAVTVNNTAAPTTPVPTVPVHLGMPVMIKT